MTLERTLDNIKVELESIGEGWGGDYVEDDPSDEELLRFSVYVLINEEWEPVDDASYCTGLPASTPEAILERALGVLLDEYYDALHDDPTVRVKKLGERLSWLKPTDFAKNSVQDPVARAGSGTDAAAAES